jgi:succinate dehydrogenase / fumarate reductase cytochrome b subunit
MSAHTETGRGAEPRRRGVAGWFDPRGRRLGGWAFALNRLSGLGVLLYLYLHLVILSTLARGEGAWNDFVALASSPVVLAFDVVLLAGLLLHGLNGLRVTLMGFGLVTGHRNAMFVALVLVAALVALGGAARIFGMV